MSAVACKDCLWWEPCDEREGQCRRHAPAPVPNTWLDPDQGYEAEWPVTLATDWCGEWESSALEDGGGPDGGGQPVLLPFAPEEVA